MAETADVIEDFIDGFNEIREEALPENSQLFLLKSAGNSKFLVVAEIITGWMIEPDEYRGQMALYIATNEAGFENKFAQTSFVGCGVPDADNEIDVFSIDPDRRDVIPPSAISPLWKVFVTREANERFTVPVLPEDEVFVFVP